jgi:uncharacterized protein
MRLLPEHIAVIKHASAELMGADVSVRLFGSRLDDQARGGDIDLLVEAPAAVPNRAKAAAHLAALIERRLGGRRVDVVLLDPATPPASVHAVAKAQGVLL